MRCQRPKARAGRRWLVGRSPLTVSQDTYYRSEGAFHSAHGRLDDLQDLDHLRHGRPVRRDLRRAHHAQLQHRQHLLLRDAPAHARVHALQRVAVLQQGAHLVHQHHHVVVPVLHRPTPRHQLQDQHAQPVDVALLVHAQALARQLRRHVPGPALLEPPAAHRHLLPPAAVRQQPRQPELAHRRVALRVRKEDVARLHVVVHQRRPERMVQVRQRPGRPGQHAEPLLPRHRLSAAAAVQPRLQAAARRVVRDQQLQLRRPVVALQRQQVRVPRLPQHAHLPLELLARPHHARRRQLLHSHHAPVAHGSAVHRAERAAPDLRRLAQQRVRAGHQVLRPEAAPGAERHHLAGGELALALAPRCRRRRRLGRRAAAGHHALVHLLLLPVPRADTTRRLGPAPGRHVEQRDHDDAEDDRDRRADGHHGGHAQEPPLPRRAHATAVRPHVVVVAPAAVRVLVGVQHQRLRHVHHAPFRHQRAADAQVALQRARVQALEHARRRQPPDEAVVRDVHGQEVLQPAQLLGNLAAQVVVLQPQDLQLLQLRDARRDRPRQAVVP
uniref:Uncharacterized protein n=1 Tax=Zea mays TaxID=4577 RepID=A0A804N7D3_MAIZE